MADYFINYNEQSDLFEVVEATTEVCLRAFVNPDDALTYLENLSLNDY